MDDEITWSALSENIMVGRSRFGLFKIICLGSEGISIISPHDTERHAGTDIYQAIRRTAVIFKSLEKNEEDFLKQQNEMKEFLLKKSNKT